MTVFTAIATAIAIMVPVLTGAFWFDDRHAHEEDLQVLAGWVKKEADQAIKARVMVERKIKRQELELMKTLDRCKLPRFKKYCELLQRQLDEKK